MHIKKLPKRFQDWIAAVDADPFVPSQAQLDYEEDWPEAFNESCCIVGNYSEAFHACSYNDDDVLLSLLGGGMNTEAAFRVKTNDHWFLHQIGSSKPADGDYEGLLMRAVLAARTWPESYGRARKLGEYVEEVFEKRPDALEWVLARRMTLEEMLKEKEEHKDRMAAHARERSRQQAAAAATPPRFVGPIDGGGAKSAHPRTFDKVGQRAKQKAAKLARKANRPKKRK